MLSERNKSGVQVSGRHVFLDVKIDDRLRILEPVSDNMWPQKSAYRMFIETKSCDIDAFCGRRVREKWARESGRNVSVEAKFGGRQLRTWEPVSGKKGGSRTLLAICP